MREPVEYRRACPQNGRLREGMGAILGYARVSTGDQDVAGQTLRLTQAGALKVFSDTRSGRTMERPGLGALLAYALMETRSRLSVSTALAAHSANCLPW
jgi:predicted site-specific integrase-resolvase